MSSSSWTLRIRQCQSVKWLRMAGTVLENLSGRKLFVFTGILLLGQLTCFLIGGLIAPPSSSSNDILATKCFDGKGNRTRWLYSRGPGDCHQLRNYEDAKSSDNVVFTFQIPLPRGNVKLDYSRWQQNLIGIILFEIVYERNNPVVPGTKLKLDARLAYQNKEDSADDWKLYAESIEERTLDCSIEMEEDEYNYYHYCRLIPLFELGSLHHDYYLLNIRLPSSESDKGQKYNQGIGKLEEIHMITINQNSGFTQVWLTIKSFFTLTSFALIIWYWRRVQAQGRSPVLLENMILSLALAVQVLNVPVEWLTLTFDMPYMLLLNDIRQGILYAVLLFFCLVFAAEHLMEAGPERHTLITYWKHLSGVLVGCTSLFLLDICERVTHVANPFYSLWTTTPVGTRLALGLIIAAGILASLYFVFLCWMIWRVFRNISTNRADLPVISTVRGLHYQGIMYRYKILLSATLVCAAMTCIGFILGHVKEDKWKYDREEYPDPSEFTSALRTGLYGMWNIYIMALLYLYAPSHKCCTPGGHKIISNEILRIRTKSDQSEFKFPIPDCNCNLGNTELDVVTE